MCNYTGIKSSAFDGNRNFVINRLLELKERLKDAIPTKKADDNFLLATWNIREFERATFGPRLDETYYYIAEIVNSFDLVAIQEVREDLRALTRLLRILGPHWSYLVTDITEGRAGNGERMAFVYDSRKVRFTNIAGEVVLPPIAVKKKTLAGTNGEKQKTKYKPVAQFSRTPYLVSFRSGWFKFNLCTVHILYGDVKDTTERVNEISNIAQFFKKRMLTENKLQSDKDYWDRINYILLGDFNILSRTDKTFKALTTDTGFNLPKGIEKNVLTGTNVSKEKFYDQIVLNEKNGNATILNAGVFDYFQYVYREEDFDQYKAAMKEARSKTGKAPDTRYYKQWRTYQMSDHLPMWVEFDINFSKRYLTDRMDKEE